MIYWLADPIFFLGYQTRERVKNELWPAALEDFDMLREIERRFAEDGFATAQFAYDPANDKGLDRTSKRPRVRPIPVYKMEGGQRVQVNANEPYGAVIDPRTVLPAVMFEPIAGRG